LPLRVDITSYAHRESAIQRGLKKRLAQLADERERRQRAAEKADEDFSLEFLSAAREVFTMIDDDESGTLEKPEMSARGVRPSTRRARRGDGVRSAAAPAVRRVSGGSYAIDVTRRLPPDPPAASRLSRATKK
jgi:hypothetical protein